MWTAVKSVRRRVFFLRDWIFYLLMGPKEVGEKESERAYKWIRQCGPSSTHMHKTGRGASVCTCVGNEYIRLQVCMPDISSGGDKSKLQLCYQQAPWLQFPTLLCISWPRLSTCLSTLHTGQFGLRSGLSKTSEGTLILLLISVRSISMNNLLCLLVSNIVHLTPFTDVKQVLKKVKCSNHWWV